jgi:hypothetical protein
LLELTSVADDASWTPYGLEAIRVQHARRRRRIAALALIAAALLLLVIFRPGTTDRLSVSVNGQEVGGDQFSIDVPQDQKPKDGPVTVSISPGRVTLASADQGASTAPQVSRANVPAFSTAPPIRWSYYLLVYGPWLLLALALWMLAKRRGKHDEVNFGVHKGAMPLEMISAHARDQVHTKRHAKVSIFGKRREDYLPDHIAKAEEAEG